MTLKITRLQLDQDVSAELADALEQVARETLDEVLADDVSVRFGKWHSDTGALQIVCKVEAAGDPFLPGWRWWSRLCSSPEDLRDALTEVSLQRGVAQGLQTPALVRRPEPAREDTAGSPA
jgi:hypothetical protein